MAPTKSLFFILVIIFISAKIISAEEECQTEESPGNCVSSSRAFPIKIIAVVSILFCSIVGVGLPLFPNLIPVLHPDHDFSVLVKAFAAGIILATAFIHVLPDSFELLSSGCLSEKPWHSFPFTGFVAMLSAVFALMVDSVTTSFYTTRNYRMLNRRSSQPEGDIEMGNIAEGGAGSSHFHSHGHHHGGGSSSETQLLRYRVVAMVLELGIFVHSIVIGIGVGASNNVCTIRPLVTALCFHQFFEGIGLGGCIMQAEYRPLRKYLMVFFFAVTTPAGVAIGMGMGLSNSYKENSPKALITVGLLNASSAGLLMYMALVELLAGNFMGAKLQASIRLQFKAYAAVFVGAGGMSVLAIWA